MRYSLSAIGGNPGVAERDRAQLFGFACDLARSSKAHNRVPAGVFLEMLRSAIEVEQIKVYFSNYGECMGYLTWAFLSPAVETRFLRGNDFSLDISEWNEGGSLWIMDLLVPRGSLRYILRDMRDNLFPEYETVTYFRLKRSRRIVKRLSRLDFCSFLAAPENRK